VRSLFQLQACRQAQHAFLHLAGKRVEPAANSLVLLRSGYIHQLEVVRHLALRLYTDRCCCVSYERGCCVAKLILWSTFASSCRKHFSLAESAHGGGAVQNAQMTPTEVRRLLFVEPLLIVPLLV